MGPSAINLSAIKKKSWSIRTTYNVSQIISYNLALGASGSNLTLVYEGHPNFHALPTFGAVHGIAVMSLVHRAMSDFIPNFQGHSHVHGEHFLSMKRAYPIPKATGTVTLNTTAKVIDIVDRRSGVLVCVDIVTMVEETGDVLCENEWGGFVMNVPTAGSNKSQLQRGARTILHPKPNRKPDETFSHKTCPEQAALYRAASGDLNPLHIDPIIARSAGFPAPILTGTCTLGIGVRHVIDAFAGGDGRRFKAVKCRFSKPLFAAMREEVRTEMWREGNKVLFTMVVGGDGAQGEEKAVITQGCVEFEEQARL